MKVLEETKIEHAYDHCPGRQGKRQVLRGKTPFAQKFAMILKVQFQKISYTVDP